MTTTMPVETLDLRPHAAKLGTTGVRLLVRTPTMTWDLWVYDQDNGLSAGEASGTASLDVRFVDPAEGEDGVHAAIPMVLQMPGCGMPTRAVAVIAR